MKRYYPAIIEKNPAAAKSKAKGKGMRGLFGVSFRTWTAAIPPATRIDEAIRNAEEALKLHLEGMVEEGQDLPAASSADDAVARKRHVPEGDIAVVAMIGAALPSAQRCVSASPWIRTWWRRSTP
jgi:predicted RNase H-like HicB family nuclease